MATIGLGVYLYKVIDGVADVYEGRLQQADKLYLAGMSQTLRSVGVIAVFSVALFLTRSMPIAAKIASREPTRSRPPLCAMRPALRRALFVQPYREHAQVCDGRHAGLQIPAVL